MSEERTTIDANYKKAFNQGYQFAKEVGISSDTLKDVSKDSPRMQALRDGMRQYSNELTQDIDKEIVPPLDLDSFDNSHIDLDDSDKSKDKGMDMDL